MMPEAGLISRPSLETEIAVSCMSRRRLERLDESPAAWKALLIQLGHRLQWPRRQTLCGMQHVPRGGGAKRASQPCAGRRLDQRIAAPGNGCRYADEQTKPKHEFGNRHDIRRPDHRDAHQKR